MSLVLIHSERFVEHQTPPGHPERPERAEVFDAVAAIWRKRGGDVVAPRAATGEQLARVHDEAYLRRIEDVSGRAVALDPDTYTSPESVEIALLAAGAAVEAVERAMNGPALRALALVRPPGHHAERNRAMGFCLYNNVAVAAAHARAIGAGRVAIVDYDVHHGNGTQHMFEADPSVLYVSTHQYPYYPGTGAAEEVGRGDGAGTTINLPLEAGAFDEDYRLVFAEVIGPVLRQFKPDLLLISAGFDAHERDPLGGMRLTTPAFGAMTGELRAIAEECCGGRIAAVTEGGYDLHALAASLEAVIQTLDESATNARLKPRATGSSEARVTPSWPSSDSSHVERGRVSVSLAKRALAPYWRL